jgi:hypothetical protein
MIVRPEDDPELVLAVSGGRHSPRTRFQGAGHTSLQRPRAELSSSKLGLDRRGP